MALQKYVWWFPFWWPLTLFPDCRPDKAALNIHVRLYDLMLSCLLDNCLGVELLGHMGGMFRTLRNCKRVFQICSTIFNFLHLIFQFYFVHILANACFNLFNYFYSNKLITMSNKSLLWQNWHFDLKFYFKDYNFEQIFMSLFSICVFSLVSYMLN